METDNRRSPVTAGAFALLAMAWLTMVVVGSDLFIVSPLLPLISADYAVPASAAGLSVTVFAVTYMLSAPALGHLADQVGRGRVLTWCLCRLWGSQSADGNRRGFHLAARYEDRGRRCGRRRLALRIFSRREQRSTGAARHPACDRRIGSPDVALLRHTDRPADRRVARMADRLRRTRWAESAPRRGE